MAEIGSDVWVSELGAPLRRNVSAETAPSCFLISSTSFISAPRQHDGGFSCFILDDQLFRLPSLISILGCPIARKRRLEEAEQEQEQEAERPASKRKSHPLKLALDEGFSAESDASSEAEGEAEKDGEKAQEAKDVAEEEEKEANGEEEREEVTDYHQQDGQKEEEPTEEEEEEEGDIQKEENFAADEGCSSVTCLSTWNVEMFWSVEDYISSDYLLNCFNIQNVF